MSQWTHVAGCIRIDGLLALGIEPDLSCLGRVVTWDDLDGDADPLGLPMGSEGSLRFEVLRNPDPGQMAAFTVPVWGDLRDYDDVDEIEAWFRKVVVESGLMIRDAVLSVEVEFARRYVLTTVLDKDGRCLGVKRFEQGG